MEKRKIISIAFAAVIIIAALTGIILAVFGIIYFLKSSEPSGLEPLANIERSIGISNWEEYRNDRYGYKIKHPREAVVEELAIEDSYINNIPQSCVKVVYKSGVIYIRALDSNIPCGPAELNERDEKIYEPVKIGEKRYEASGYKASASEFLMVNPYGINIIYGVSGEMDKESKNAIRKIVGSFERIY
jgi:hypothetical protein